MISPLLTAGFLSLLFLIPHSFAASCSQHSPNFHSSWNALEVKRCLCAFVDASSSLWRFLPPCVPMEPLLNLSAQVTFFMNFSCSYLLPPQDSPLPTLCCHALLWHWNTLLHWLASPLSSLLDYRFLAHKVVTPFCISQCPVNTSTHHATESLLTDFNFTDSWRQPILSPPWLTSTPEKHQRLPGPLPTAPVGSALWPRVNQSHASSAGQCKHVVELNIWKNYKLRVGRWC